MPDFDLRDQPPMPPDQRPSRPSRLSQTFLRHAAHCPRSGALYLLYGGGAGSEELDRGTAIHRIGERMGKEALEAGEPVVPHELVREIVNDVLADPDLTIAPSQIDFIHACAYHLSRGLTFDPQAIVALETKVALEIGGWTIVGKIDYAWASGDRAGVKDYKTSMNLPDNTAWGPGETDEGKKRIRHFLFQTLLYALLLVYGRPVSETTDPDSGETIEYLEDTPLAPRAQFLDLAEVYPAYLIEDENGAMSLAERKTTITLAELENHRRWLETLIAKIDYRLETGDWPAIPGSHCNQCPAERLCPLPAWARDRAFDPDTGEVILVDSNEGARAALALRDRLMAEAAELWEQAKDWADRGNTIIVGDQVYEFAPVKSRSVRKSKGSADWDGLVEAVQHAAETGEPFDVEKWIKSNNSTRFVKRALKPNEKTPDYPEEVEHGQQSAAERFGDVPF